MATTTCQWYCTEDLRQYMVKNWEAANDEHGVVLGGKVVDEEKNQAVDSLCFSTNNISVNIYFTSLGDRPPNDNDYLG